MIIIIDGSALRKKLSCTSNIPSVPFVTCFTSWPEFESIWNLIARSILWLKKAKTFLLKLKCASLSEYTETNRRSIIVTRPTHIHNIRVCISKDTSESSFSQREIRISITSLKNIGSKRAKSANRKLEIVRSIF